MKIVFIKRLHEAAGGAERVCWLCSKFADLGYDVIIVSFDPPGSVSFYTLSEKVTWIQLGIGKASEKSTIAEFLSRTIKIRRLSNRQIQICGLGSCTRFHSIKHRCNWNQS